MRILVKVEDQSAALAQRQGAPAEIWIFDLAFRRLALLLTKPEAEEILYVAGVDCRHHWASPRDSANLCIAPSDKAADAVEEVQEAFAAL